jgi:hypothetical protein
MMTFKFYRLTLFHARVHKAISAELAREAPNALRLLRLRQLRHSIKARLTLATRTLQPATQ